MQTSCQWPSFGRYRSCSSIISLSSELSPSALDNRLIRKTLVVQTKHIVGDTGGISWICWTSLVSHSADRSNSPAAGVNNETVSTACNISCQPQGWLLRPIEGRQVYRVQDRAQVTSTGAAGQVALICLLSHRRTDKTVITSSCHPFWVAVSVESRSYSYSGVPQAV